MRDLVAHPDAPGEAVFLRDDGLLTGYYEVDDDGSAQLALASDPDGARWEEDAARFFVDLDGARPDQSAPHLREVFTLEDWLRMHA